MKKNFLVLSAFIFGLAQALAQTPVQFPAAPGSPQSPFNLGLPGFNNSFGPLFTNQFGNGFASTPLNQLLIQVQFDLTQLYPVVVAINNGFDFNVAVTNANGTVVSATIASPGTASTSANTSASQNLSRDTALGGSGTTLGGSGTALSGGGTALGGSSLALTPNTTTTTGTVAGGSAAVTNALVFSSTRDVLRALLLLQDDIERMLPLINALNGGNAASLNTLFTNNLGVLTNSTIRTGTNGASMSTTGR
jgi:hypothetical protein